ncbi:MAG: sugar ABC transporter permease [Deltaproteobacteria bacterium]|nr:sugar ABC transporter permease [Deltaproteobacteria bacterium]
MKTAKTISFIKKHYFEISLALPLFLYLVLFTYAPVMQVIAMSFDKSGSRPGFVFGFHHYHLIFGHFQFAKAFFNTVFIAVCGLFLELALGLYVAVQLNKRIKFRGMIRSLYILPLGIPTIVAAANMRYIFDTNGFLNSLLMKLNMITLPVDWGGGGFVTLFAVVVADMWKVTPLVMLVLLAGLQNIPEDVYEAARMDGAGPWQTFRHITLPLLKPSITMAVVIRGIDSFRIFELPLVLAGKAEPVLGTFVYAEYHEALNPYTSAAASVILLLLILFCVAAYLSLTGTKDVSYP